MIPFFPLEQSQRLKGPIVALKRLGGRFGYFLFFFCSGVRGGGEGEFEAPGRGGGDRSFIEDARRGGGFSRWGGGGGEGPGGCLRRIGEFFFWGGGGAKYFFSGPKCPPRRAKPGTKSKDSRGQTEQKRRFAQISADSCRLASSPRNNPFERRRFSRGNRSSFLAGSHRFSQEIADIRSKQSRLKTLISLEIQS